MNILIKLFMLKSKSKLMDPIVPKSKPKAKPKPKPKPKPKKKIIIKCAGYTISGNKCRHNVDVPEPDIDELTLPGDCSPIIAYCKKHEYCVKFDDTQMQLIKDKDPSVKICKKCTHFYFNELSMKCDDCALDDGDVTGDVSTRFCKVCSKYRLSNMFFTPGGASSSICNGCIDMIKQRRSQTIVMNQAEPEEEPDVPIHNHVPDTSKTEICIQIKKKYWMVQKFASRANKRFQLTFDEAAELMQSGCIYCGAQVQAQVQEQGQAQGQAQEQEHEQEQAQAQVKYTISDIVLLDPTGNYTFENCASSCKGCRLMRCDIWDREEFVKVATHILAINKFIPLDINNNLHGELFFDYDRSNQLYQRCQKDAGKLGILFKLSYDDFLKIRASDCYICHKPNKSNNSNGVGRVVVDDGPYDKYNCKSCCSNCIGLKGSSSLIDFFAKLYQIYLFDKKYDFVIDDQFLDAFNSYCWAIGFDKLAIKKIDYLTE